MKINELFYSIQGEGKSAGKPRLFIRLSGCNLRCSFCDTKYHINSRELNKKDISLLKKYKLWVITGGEPLLYQKEILNLIKEYEPDFVDIETNGTLIPEIDFAHKISCFNISPKEARFQLEGYKRRTEPKILSTGSMINDRIIKFIYKDKKSEEFIAKMVNKYNIQPFEIWIMPEGATRKDQCKTQKEAWNYCIKKDYNYSPRLQVDVWDTKKSI